MFVALLLGDVRVVPDERRRVLVEELLQLLDGRVVLQNRDARVTSKTLSSAGHVNNAIRRRSRQERHRDADLQLNGSS